MKSRIQQLRGVSRRSAERIATAQKVTYAVNDGPIHSGLTIDLTHNSLAIHSASHVKRGDFVSAQIENLPPVEGRVVRVLEEGFAIQLAGVNYAIVAHAQCERAAKTLSKERAVGNVLSQTTGVFFRLVAKQPAWARFATEHRAMNIGDRHFLTIVSEEDLDVDNVSNVWVNIDDSRWVARLIRIGHRDHLSMVVIALNDWQMRMAAVYGLSVCIVFEDLKEWTAAAPLKPVANYLEALEGKATPLTAERKCSQPSG